MESNNYKILYKYAGVAVAVCIGLVFLYWMGFGHYLSLDFLATRKDMLKYFVRYNYVPAVFYYIALYTVLIACAVPAVAPLTLLGGFLFGVFPTIVYALIGMVAGGMALFLVLRYLLGKTVYRRYKTALAEFNHHVHTYGASNYLLSLQFLTVVPFFAIATLASLAKVNTKTFMWTTAVGSLPSIIVYSFAGRQMTGLRSMRDVMSWPVVLVFAALLLLALVPMIVRKVRAIHHDRVHE